MRAWVVDRPAPADEGPLVGRLLPVPQPVAGQVLVRTLVCAVCRTDLHLAEGDLQPHRPGTAPGHEVVGEVVALGPGTEGLSVGQRVGVAWLYSTCGHCRFCLRGSENLCEASRYTGWDVDGGYAEYVVAAADYVYTLPAGYSDEELAPLLCAGIIGYRALEAAALPTAGRLGIYGFGASAHLAAQVAIARGAEVHVMTRSAEARRLAERLGAASTGRVADRPPVALDAAVLFAPAGELVPVALEALDAGGTLSIAGIHLSDIPSLDYQRHLFRERRVRSVTANTRDDGRAFLAFAATHRLEVTTTPYPFEAAGQALADLADDRVKGAAVLRVAGHATSG